MNQGELDQAIEAYQEGLRLEPESAVGRNLLGMAYRMKFNQERDLRWKELELDAFREAVAVDSTYWPACINLGATLYFQGDHEEASRWFRRALEINPDNPERDRIEGMIEDSAGPRTD
jgi:tetratricopeptide (TPR) repeat protein